MPAKPRGSASGEPQAASAARPAMSMPARPRMSLPNKIAEQAAANSTTRSLRPDPAVKLRMEPAAISGEDRASMPRAPIAPPFVTTKDSAAPAHALREREVLAKLEAELRALEGKTAWAILGLSQGADADEIKRAFFDASKRYHPHLFARYGEPEIKRVVTELFISHKRAYATMQKSIARPSRLGGTK
jgi:hypothetical protein